MNGILKNIEKIDMSLIALGHLADIDDEMELYTVQHLINVLQRDMVDHNCLVMQAVRKIQAEQSAEIQARQEVQLLMKRIEAALQFLAAAGDAAISANVKCDDRAITEHIGMAACRIGAAMRALRAQGEYERLNITGKKCA